MLAGFERGVEVRANHGVELFDEVGAALGVGEDMDAIAEDGAGAVEAEWSYVRDDGSNEGDSGDEWEEKEEDEKGED